MHIARPMKAGVITDWEDMETIWHHTFCEKLRVRTAVISCSTSPAHLLLGHLLQTCHLSDSEDMLQVVWRPLVFGVGSHVHSSMH
jgi:actin-related protein